MSATPAPSPRRAPGRRRIGAFSAPLLLVVIALGGASAGCTGSHGDAATSAPSTAWTTPSQPAEAAVPMDGMTMPTAAEVDGTWANRPAFVSGAGEATQAAYAYALARPDVLQWLPCYCGCAASGHRSNLDCFFVRREVGGSYVYEEHASFCDVCVQTANMAQQMLREGKTIVQVRAAVDATFGGNAPGTPTKLPPSA